MEINEIFSFLISDYLMAYKFQEFENYPSGNWYSKVYSYYNESGCFSIYTLPQRGEYEYYYAKAFSTDIKELLQKVIEVDVKHEIWQNASKKIFFGYRQKLQHQAFANYIKYLIKEKGEFYGIKVDRTGL